MPSIPFGIIADPRTRDERRFDRGLDDRSHVDPRPHSPTQVIGRCEDEAAALIDEAEHWRQALGDAPDSGAHPGCTAPCCIARRRARSQLTVLR